MAKSKSKSTRKPSTKTKVSTLTRKQLDSVGLANVSIQTPDWRPVDPDDDVPRFFRVPLAARFEFGWEFDNVDGDTEFLYAAFDGQTLLKTAVNLGLLRETYEKQRRVPKGELPPMHEPNFHQKLAAKMRKSKSA